MEDLVGGAELLWEVILWEPLNCKRRRGELLDEEHVVGEDDVFGPDFEVSLALLKGKKIS